MFVFGYDKCLLLLHLEHFHYMVPQQGDLTFIGRSVSLWDKGFNCEKTPFCLLEHYPQIGPDFFYYYYYYYFL